MSVDSGHFYPVDKPAYSTRGIFSGHGFSIEDFNSTFDNDPDEDSDFLLSPLRIETESSVAEPVRMSMRESVEQKLTQVRAALSPQPLQREPAA